MDTFEIRKQALAREEQRALQISSVMVDMPKRRSAELSRVCKLIELSDKILGDCDLMPETSPLAAAVETAFEMALERVNEIKLELAAEAAAAGK